jgi:hypothetical protein
MAPRKKWRTRTWVGSRWVSHPSQAAAYRYIQREAQQFQAGMLRAEVTHVTVQVDEGLGRGWELFERVSLAELAEDAS